LFYPDAETTDEPFITHIYHTTGQPIGPIRINAALRVTDNGKNNGGSGGGDYKTNIRGQWVTLEQSEVEKKVLANEGGSSPMTMSIGSYRGFNMELSQPPEVGETVTVTVTSEYSSYVEFVAIGTKLPGSCDVEWFDSNSVEFTRADWSEARWVKLLAYEITDAVDINCVPDSNIGEDWESDTVTIRVLNSYNPPDSPEDPDPEDSEEKDPVYHNNPPTKPEIEGPDEVKAGEMCSYSFNSTDADGDEIYYIVVWPPQCCGQTPTEYGPYESGHKLKIDFQWPENLEPGNRNLIAYAKDTHENMSEPTYFNVEIYKEKFASPHLFILSVKGLFTFIYQLIEKILTF